MCVIVTGKAVSTAQQATWSNLPVILISKETAQSMHYIRLTINMDSKISTCKYEVQDHFVTIVQEQQEKHIHLSKLTHIWKLLFTS